MSALIVSGDGEGPPRPAARPPDVYLPRAPSLACGGAHSRSGGQLDEKARRLSHEELAVARALVADGHDVRSLPESRGGGRRPDLAVCGGTLEVKSFVPAPERGGGSPSPYSVYNKLVDAAGQSDQAVIYGVGSGLTERAAQKGLDRYASAPTERPKLDHIRIIGDGFDLPFSRRPDRAIERSPRRPDRGPDLGL